jgi:hypothetical protein
MPRRRPCMRPRARLGAVSRPTGSRSARWRPRAERPQASWRSHGPSTSMRSPRGPLGAAARARHPRGCLIEALEAAASAVQIASSVRRAHAVPSDSDGRSVNHVTFVYLSSREFETTQADGRIAWVCHLFLLILVDSSEVGGSNLTVAMGRCSPEASSIKCAICFRVLSRSSFVCLISSLCCSCSVRSAAEFASSPSNKWDSIPPFMRRLGGAGKSSGCAGSENGDSFFRSIMSST